MARKKNCTKQGVKKSQETKKNISKDDSLETSYVKKKTALKLNGTLDKKKTACKRLHWSTKLTNRIAELEKENGRLVEELKLAHAKLNEKEKSKKLLGVRASDVKASSFC